MAKDPAFLFYPGDYLRDTQCMSEKTQVAYDRIICEHMRNICIRQQQLKFFTKNLSEDEKEELMIVLDKIKGGFQISWVAESINKRKAFSESRRKNRSGKNKKHMNKMSLSYDVHMENENENENISKDVIENKEKRKTNFLNDLELLQADHPKEMLKDFFEYWTESGVKDKKLRFELAKNKPFDISRRLSTWKKNQRTFNSGQSKAEKNKSTVMNRNYEKMAEHIAKN